MDSAFSAHFSQLLKERGLTMRDFAALTGASYSSVSKAAEGHSNPPKALREWGEALNLMGSDLERFLELGYLELTPDFIRERYLKMKAERS